MKLIEAVIRPVKVGEVKSVLKGIGVEEFMESALICHGRLKGQVMSYRGAEYAANFVEKVKLEIIAADDSVGKVVEAIGSAAGKDECRVFILPFVEAC